jgi:ribosomal protein S27AE
VTVGIKWEHLVEVRSWPDGKVLARNRDLCPQCSALRTVESDNQMLFCQQCGHTRRRDPGQEQPHG